VYATLSGAADQDVSVTLEHPGVGTATLTDDYTLGTTIVITAGDTVDSLTLSAVDDVVFEGNETVEVTISGVTGPATENGEQQQAVTITDDETEPTVQFAAATQSGTEGTAVTVTVELSGASAQTITVAFAVNAILSTADGADYTIDTTSPLTFAPGETARAITVTLIDDATPEILGQTLVLVLSDPNNAALGVPGTNELTINDP
jgi:hypothetical protein